MSERTAGTSPVPAVALDLRRVPWSFPGSFMALSATMPPADHPGGRRDVAPGLFLRDVSGARLFRWNAVFRLSGLAGRAPTEVEVQSADPALVSLRCGAGLVDVTWDGPDTLRLRGRDGAALRLTETVVDVFDSAVAFPDGHGAWRLQMGEDAHYVLTRLHGDVRVDAPAVRTGAAASTRPKTIDVHPGADGAFEVALTQYESGHRRPAAWRSFEQCRAGTADAFARWRAEYRGVAPGLTEAAGLAAYLTWSSLAGPRGLFARPAMLMSKNWMNAVWSWDHCFNALGLARAHPDLAWDQFMVVLDRQHPQGSLPDITTDSTLLWGFVKPPVHGWTLRLLDEAGVVTAERLAEVYPRLAAWTRWWLTYRDLDGDGLCAYFHGNDSGQDNATAFDAGFPAASPDLAALLVVQMDVLADAARRLGRRDEAEVWAGHADSQLGQLLDRLWDGERFVVLPLGGGAPDPRSRSQIEFLPLVLGQRLPAAVRTAVVERLVASGSLTPFGLASESPDSPLHEPDGYWRGPVWAPTTLLVADGLARCGEHDLAGRLAGGFVEACRRSGFAENYDAVTGEARRDPAYSWSASVFWALLEGSLGGPAQPPASSGSSG